MVTAAGFNSRSTCAAIRAGVSGVGKDNIWDPSAGENMSVGRPHTPQWWEGPDMLAELAAPAISECLAALPKGIERKNIPILIILSPADRPCREPELEQTVIAGIPDPLHSTPTAGWPHIRSGRPRL